MVTSEFLQEIPETEVLTDITPEVIEDFQRLLPQLTGDIAPPLDIIKANLLAATDPQTKIHES